MDSFNKHLLPQEYQKLAQLGDRLAAAEHQLEWDPFRHLLTDQYANQRPQGDTPIRTQ